MVTCNVQKEGKKKKYLFCQHCDNNNSKKKLIKLKSVNSNI